MVRVEEMLSARANVRPLGVATDSEEINEVTAKLDTLELEITSEQLMRYEHLRPFDHFGTERLDGS